MRQRTFIHFDQPAFMAINALARDNYADLQEFQETDEAFLASFDMPGLNPSDINIELEDERLKITAERKKLFDKSGEALRKYSRFFTVPKNIDIEKIDAHYENGVLNLTLPKVAELKHKKKIIVQTGDKPKAWNNFLSFTKSSDNKVVSN